MIEHCCSFGSDLLKNHVSYVSWGNLNKRLISLEQSKDARFRNLRECAKMKPKAFQPLGRMFASKSEARVLHEQFQPLIEKRTVLWITYFVASYTRSYLALC